MEVTAVFDIGKTHKKFLLLDEELQVLIEDSRRISEIEDDDGYPCDDLAAITKWVLDKVETTKAEGKFLIRKLNFSAYGASLVHLDADDQPVTPLYNYLKPYPEELAQEFYEKYGPASRFSVETSSPRLGMLNSGLQLFWLKKQKPEIFNSITTSLHLPNYFAFLFHQKKLSEFTSIGCHTGLWDFGHRQYHQWVEEEKVKSKFPEIVDCRLRFKNSRHPEMEVGCGLHDSSSALIPYLLRFKNPFVLLSTGTWNISLNPFNHEILSAEDLAKDSLHYFSYDGKPVMANRLFLGNEHDLLNRKLSEHFNKGVNYHKIMKPDEALIQELMTKKGCGGSFNLKEYFSHESSITPLNNDFNPQDFATYEEGYHDLLLKLSSCQVQSIEYTFNETDIKDIYITGGFIDNQLFTQLIARHFYKKNIYITSLQRASAVGAALIMQDNGATSYDKLITARKINP